MCPSSGRGYRPDQPFITGPDDLHGWNDTVSTDVRISYQIFPAEHVLDENTVFFAPQQEPLSVVKATRVKNPAAEVLAMDIADDEGGVGAGIPQRGNHPEAIHNGWNPGILTGWMRAQHDGHVKWVQHAELEVMAEGTGGWITAYRWFR